ncbi:hypothetical protein GOZ86_02205 [Agrobacterium vitis]|uniref:Uncharacterized protein n=1 Tax=Agrobacterium vitis TaxID=373 RepID=A0AAE4W8Z1_AGRVI|nr:hypothetical protein [Agrobacterium vitis]MVA64766.1 hypothetical protein [Agrobacterium vitis]MVA85737.1 hypothetical protein [Agrobacterium vitis]
MDSMIVLICRLPPSALPGISPSRGEIDSGFAPYTSFLSRIGDPDA